MPAMSGFASLMVLQVISLEVYLRYPAITKPALIIEHGIKEATQVERDRLFRVEAGGDSLV